MFKKITTMGWLGIASVAVAIFYFRKPLLAKLKSLFA